MMPDSIKIVVLDRRLPVKKAFFALVQNGQYTMQKIFLLTA